MGSSRIIPYWKQDQASYRRIKMQRIIPTIGKTSYSIVVIAIIISAARGICPGSDASTETQALSVYKQWDAIGRYAAERSLDLIKKVAVAPQKGNMIVLTNAGYAEVNGAPTRGDADDDKRPPLAGPRFILSERMVMCPALNGFRMHLSTLFDGCVPAKPEIHRRQNNHIEKCGTEQSVKNY
jgi:hypothetical protein